MAPRPSPQHPLQSPQQSKTTGYWLLATRSNTRFHPLKAGRRRHAGVHAKDGQSSFHPLKAGRRPELNTLRYLNSSVSIPSRRVGDMTRTGCLFRPIIRFPSPQGGSETLGCRCGRDWQGKFPSPQGGSETIRRVVIFDGRDSVSIPSRRVGDHPFIISTTRPYSCFHPLKAGRRRPPKALSERSRVRFHPLKAGRRPSDMTVKDLILKCFHPLKAGRRPLMVVCCPFIPLRFPSPQGGSETNLAP